MLAETRIQLEGQLEVVEEAVHRWQSAARKLEGEEWVRGEWLAAARTPTDEEYDAMSDLAARHQKEPNRALIELLHRAETVQRKLVSVVKSRLAMLDEPSDAMDLDQLVGKIRPHLPILYRGWLGFDWTVPARLIAMGVALLIPLLGWASTGVSLDKVVPAAVLLVVYLGAMTVYTLSMCPRVLINRRALTIDDHRVVLGEIEQVVAQVKRYGTRSTVRSHVFVFLARGGVIRKDTAGDPKPFLDALRGVGVRTRLDEVTFWDSVPRR